VVVACIEGVKDKFHSWSPIVYVHDPKSGGEEASGTIAMRDDRVALPFVDGMAPSVVASRPEDNPRKQLPRLLELTPDPGFVLSSRGDQLLIQLDSNFDTSDPAQSFLIRAWRKGKMFTTLVGGSPDGQQVKMGRGAFVLAPEMAVRLIKPSADELEVQLLYCPQGWELCRPEGREGRRMGRGDIDTGFPRMSNRIAVRHKSRFSAEAGVVNDPLR
jgi:hypothetical protein